MAGEGAGGDAGQCAQGWGRACTVGDAIQGQLEAADECKSVARHDCDQNGGWKGG